MQAIEARPIVQNTATGTINWTQEFVEATGETGINRKKWPTEAEAVQMATRGAEVVAKANLLETIGDMHIRRQTVMRILMAENSAVKTRVWSLVQGARIVGEPYFGKDAVTVTVRIPMFGPDGLAAAVLPGPPERAPVEPDDTSDTDIFEWTLLLPAGTAPAFTLFPVFTDAQNALLLDGSTTATTDAAALARWYRAKPGEFFFEKNTFEARLSSVGHLMLPDAAIPVFQAWKNARETGAGALPVRVVVR
ncbi:MAG: hypothetical protein IPM98_17575 [Lewinellaceae bacterium]|nr:hypothetical protein [Lewinellaceae bacterium]